MHVEEAFAARRFSSSVTAHSTNPTLRPLWVATPRRPNASGTGEGDTGRQNPLQVFRSCHFAEPARWLTSSLRPSGVGSARVGPLVAGRVPVSLKSCSAGVVLSGRIPFLRGDHQRAVRKNEPISVARFSHRLKLWRRTGLINTLGSPER